MTHFVGNHATDGVKLVTRFMRAQLNSKGIIDPLYGRIPTDTKGSVGEAENVTGVIRNIEFIFDFTDYLLEHVFNCDQASDAAELIDHDGQVVAVAPKVTQQIIQPLGLRHKNGGTQQRTNVQFRRPLKFEQVFGHQNANDIFPFPLKYRKTRVRGIDDHMHQGVMRLVDVYQIHAGRWHHHITSGHISHTNHAFEHDAGLRTDDVVVFCLGESFNQLSR